MVKRIKTKEIPFLLLTLVIFVAVAGKYHRYWLQDAYYKVAELIDTSKSVERAKKIVGCPDNQILIKTSNGNLCRNEASPSALLDIFDKYPAVSDGREIIYSFLDEGDIKTADMMLEDKMPIERFEPVELTFPPTWEEDPYNEKYWRFMYYSLRETRHLLYAYKQTGKEEYVNKLTQTIESFLDEGIEKSYAWDDYHAVAFRTMTLVNTWWKLREENALTADLSEKILETLKRHGDFLQSNEHYEPQYNHGISQASALLLLGVNFPDLNGSEQWKAVAIRRIKEGIDTLVDNDGSLVENSPYYHFYALEKYWRIYQYYKDNKLEMDSVAQEKIDKMISYATYILQPNLRVPLLGASLDRRIGNTGAFKEIAKVYPEFSYVLTQGKEGRKPSELSKYYPTTGQAIMRSGWETKTKFENKFESQTQVIFDVGPYRTNHSDLDALSLNIYSNGKTLVTDAGLYTYEASDKLKSYFHGTAGHNTVMVDGQNQRLGSPIPGKFKQGEVYTTHSAQHNLYPQTIHQRSVTLLGHDFVVVVDRLISDKEHDYEQLFHLFPGAKTEIKDGGLVASDKSSKDQLTLRQLVGNTTVEIKDGLCSLEYEKTVTCPIASTKIHGKTATYITLLEIGDMSGFISANVNQDNVVTIETKGGIHTLSLNEMDADFFNHSKASKQETNDYVFELANEDNKWVLKGTSSEEFKVITGENNKLVISPKSPSSNENFSKRPSYTASIEGLDTYYSIEQKLYLDIPADTKIKKIKLYEQEDLLPILGYHHIISDDQKIISPTLEMHISDFENQVAYLTNSMGCRWFTFSEIMENYVLKQRKVPKRACVLNFDDGRKDHFTNGYRVFDKYGAVATFYIISQRAMSNSDAYMNLGELDELYRNGNEIGSHTVSAGSLLTDGYDKEGLVYQLNNSKKMLEDQGYKVNTFAYPRGEWNNEIVDLASRYYMAGRDTNKDNLWRDMRPVTASFGEDYIWHMHYFKPELLKPNELEKVVGYNSWWQFEEGYRVDNDSGRSIRVLSSYDPTNNSYGVVDLAEVGDRISNKFIVSQDGTYTIEVFVTANTDNNQSYSDNNTVEIFIDGTPQRVAKSTDLDKCLIHQKQYYCGYSVSAYLEKGPHTISMRSRVDGVKLDKFKMYRSIDTRKSYKISISEFKKVEARQYPDPIELKIEKSSLLRFWVLNSFNRVLKLFHK